MKLTKTLLFMQSLCRASFFGADFPRPRFMFCQIFSQLFWLAFGMRSEQNRFSRSQKCFSSLHFRKWSLLFQFWKAYFENGFPSGFQRGAFSVCPGRENVKKIYRFQRQTISLGQHPFVAKKS